MAKSKNAGKGSVAQVQDKDERRKALDAAMAQIDDLKYPWAHTYRAMMNLMTETPEPMPSKADKKIWFPGLKVMIARESTDAARGLFVALKGGSNNESHNHNDI